MLIEPAYPTVAAAESPPEQMNILLITCDFPNAYEPANGLFNQYLAEALSKSHGMRVLCPVSWATELKSRLFHRGKAKGRESGDLEVCYSRYFYPPKVLHNYYGSFLWWSIRGEARRLVRDAKPRLVLGYWAHPDGEAAVRIAREAGAVSAIIIGGSDVLLLTRNAGRRRRVVRVLQEADAVVTVNEHLKAQVISLGISAEKVHVWQQGVDERFSPGDRREARLALGIQPFGRMAVWVGRMVPVKGLEVLLAACAILKRTGQEFSLYLVGDGPLRQRLEAESAAKGLEGMVHFVGTQLHDRLADWYRAADLTVLPSWSEGLPNVLRESLACGTPFAASRVGGIPGIAGERTDWLVEPGDAEGLAAAMARGLTNPGRLPSAWKSPSWSESAASLVDICYPLIFEKSARPTKTPSGMRQFVRRAKAATLPRRLFLTDGPASSNSVCLTFDDGPHPEHTPRLLDVLRDKGVRATFFVIGMHVERFPDIVRRIAAEGHAIGNHSFSHRSPELVSSRELAGEAKRTRKLLADVVGQDVRIFRPPYGKVSAGAMVRLWRAGMKIALWNADPKDFACQSDEELAERLRATPLRAGDVVLLHDAFGRAAAVLPGVIETARKHGLSFSTVPQWMQ